MPAEMKIAHLILTHKEPEQLERLIKALDHPAVDFYIHIDKKADITPFQYLFNRHNVFMVQQRTSIYWAGYGTIQAILNGFVEVLPKNYTYINVMSGQDFPLKSPEYIYQFLKKHEGTEFITARPIKEIWSDGHLRVEKYHLVNWRWPIRGKYRLEQLINAILPKRKFPLKFEFAGGPNWFTITSAAAAHILDVLELRPDIIRYFKYCWGADEFIFATILYNSSFKDRLADCLLFVKWQPGHGHAEVLTASNFEELKASDKLFARKFDAKVDSTIFSLLEDWISNRQQQPV